MSLKPLSTTRWNAHTAAVVAILKDYPVFVATMDEIHASTHDDCGLYASGYFHYLEKFITLYGYRLTHIVATEEASLLLQRKNIAPQEALVDAAKMYVPKEITSRRPFLLCKCTDG